MLFVPLPFVVALVLVMLLALLARQNDGASARRGFLLLVAVCAVQSVLIGLRWGYDMTALRPVLPVTGAVGIVLVYVSFASLVRARRDGWRAMAPHAIPVAAVAFCVLVWRVAIDPLLILVSLFYAGALLRLARKGPDGLDRARLSQALPAYRALGAAALALTGSALFDIAIALDFDWTAGRHATAIVTVANLFWLALFGCAGLVGSSADVAPEGASGEIASPARDAAPPLPRQLGVAEALSDDAAVMATIDGLMQARKLYRDADLTLDRLARRAGIPGRRISEAINRVTGASVSTYVNRQRIAEACRRLVETDEPVTSVMLASGFQTKSNFHRAFRTVTGLSPSAFRASAASVEMSEQGHKRVANPL